MSFETLGLAKELVEKIANHGYKHPTEVQKRAIPVMVSGKQVLVLSKTGSGKTAAFLLPLAMTNERALILAPTRELAKQIWMEARKLVPHKKTVVVYGGTSLMNDRKLLSRGFDILVATPGRCYDHLRSGVIREKIDVAILDEADRMLDMGFIEDVQAIIKQTKPDRVHLFSATANKELTRLFGKPFEEIFLDQDKPEIDEEEMPVERKKKLSTLLGLLKPDKKIIVFMSTKRGTEWLGEKLSERKIRNVYINGDLTQNKRELAVRMFKEGRVDVLIATDVVARGIHIDNVDLVINYDQARDDKTHKHRVGRTGRMGTKGRAITFVETLPRIGSDERRSHGQRHRPRSRDSYHGHYDVPRGYMG
jgi:ATP-dependent RNA helicase DeaD